MAGRVVDVAEGLQALGYAEQIQGEVTIAVADQLAEWNNGTFAIGVKNGQAKVRITDSETADLSCTIGALSQLVFGRLSAQELIAGGKLTGKDATKIALLDQLFPKRDNYINEYF